MLKTYYLHGFASRFDTTSDKLKALAELGPVYGHDIDYTRDPEDVIEDSLDKVMRLIDEIRTFYMSLFHQSHNRILLPLPYNRKAGQ